VEFLEDSEIKRKYWLMLAKKDAGYEDNVSFDIVWAQTLHRAKTTFNVTPSGHTHTNLIKNKKGYKSWE